MKQIHFLGKRIVSVLLLFVIMLGLVPTFANIFGMSVYAEDGEGDSPTVCELKIRYVTAIYSEGDEMSYADIYPTYHIQVPYGYDYEKESPTIENYALTNSADAVISGTLTESSKVILVIYRESLGTAKYKVNYWTQEVDGSNLTKLESLCYEAEGEVGTSVTVKLPSVPGYSWSNDDLLVYITADGNAVKNVYYVKSEKRKLVFRTGTGYAKVVEAYPGEDITEERAAIRDVDPVKPGYVFVNWNTSIAQLGEQTIYEPDGVTVQSTYRCYVSAENSEDGKEHYYMPADDYVINAIWTKAVTQYRVVFWFEKANGSGYTDGGIDTTRYALTDTEVTFAYYDRLIADEKTLFDANFTKIKNITKDDAGNDYNFVENYSESAKDDEGNVLKDANGNDVVISYTNTYDNPVGKTFEEYKTTHFYGFDYDHCNNVTVTADGNATLNVYYKREIWTVKIYNKPSTSNNNTTWRIIEGRYGSVVPAVEENEADDINKLPTSEVAEEYYNENKPDGTTDNFQDLRTKSADSGTLFNLKAQQVFTTEDSKGLHVYSVYPYYHSGTTAKSKRVFYGANLDVLPDSSQNLSADYVNFATSISSAFSGTIQPTFIFDEIRMRKYTWEGAKFRYRSCTATTKEEDIHDDWSPWIDVDTTTRPETVNKNDVAEGEAKIFLLSDGKIAYWYFHNYDEKKDFYLEVILPRKELDLKFVSHNVALKTEKVECGMPLASYYTYTPADTATEHFVGWYEDAEMTHPVDINGVMGYEDNNIYAKWEPKQCIVTFDPRNGEATTTQTLNIASVLAMPAEPEKAGFRFVGWYTEWGSHYQFTEELDGDLALHAVWEPIEMAEYRVLHYLKHSNGDLELILEITNYDSIHKTVTVNALTNEQKPILFKNLYVVHDGSNSATQSIDLSKETLSERSATFYYSEMTEWEYTITYLDIDDKSTKIQPDVTDETDLLSITVVAPTIHVDEKTWIPVRKVGNRLIPALAGAMLTPGGQNLITIYYDEQHTLTFDLQGGTPDAIYNERHLIKTETTTVPDAPTYAGHIFLGWNTEASGSGVHYDPEQTFTMPDEDATLYAQWADISATVTDGRRLDRLNSGSNEITIAKDGSLTALFSLTSSNDIIIPSKLKLLSANSFKKDTVITLIVHSSEYGQSRGKYYYYKVTSPQYSVSLTDFYEMGSKTTRFGISDKLNSIDCQVCVEFPQSDGIETLCISAYSANEAGANVKGVFGDYLIRQPSGCISVTDNTDSSADAGSFNATVTVDSLSDFIADQSDSRHTHDTLASYESILTVMLKDGEKLVPFPENSTLKIGDELIKTTGTVVGILTNTVNNGDYYVTATGLPTDRDIKVCFTLCASDSSFTYQKEHPMRLSLGSASVDLAYQPQAEYAIRAELVGGDINRVFASPTVDKELTFNVSYLCENSDAEPQVLAFVKQEGTYVEISEFTADISTTGGNAIATVTIPQNMPSGTYRLKFTVGTACFNYNLIITED